MSRRLLVVATAPDPSDEVLERLAREAGDVEVAVVSPASDASPVEWLSDDDASAREAAQHRALEAAEASSAAARVVTAQAGDPDPVTAVEDALQVFPADELIVVTRPKDAATWLERRAIAGDLERFGLPVTHLIDDEVERPPDDVRPLVWNNFWLGFVLRHVLLTLALGVGVLTVVALCLYYIVS
jgi:hypothetical protein